MGAESGRRGPLTGRPSSVRTRATLVLAIVVAPPLILFGSGAGRPGFAVDHHRRAREIEAREGPLYRQLAERDAVFETQRRIYVKRLQSLEAQIHQKDQEIVALRARLATISSSPAAVAPIRAD
jgi:hypothetical protein